MTRFEFEKLYLENIYSKKSVSRSYLDTVEWNSRNGDICTLCGNRRGDHWTGRCHHPRAEQGLEDFHQLFRTDNDDFRRALAIVRLTT